MGNVRDARAAAHAPGAGYEPALAARSFRDVLVTRQHARESAEWSWPAQPSGGGETAVLMTAEMPLTVARGEGPAQEVQPGALCFLHPHRVTQIVASGSGAVTCVWVPWHALAEIESELRAPGEVIPPSALVRGLQAFLESLLTGHSEPAVTTDHLVERLVVEMAFGVLVEAAPRPAGTGRISRIDRARSVMLVRRSERGFGVSALARDMHLSVRQLQRLFAAEGSAPADELRRIRVELARELLRDEDHTGLGLAEIAEHAGFSDAAGLRRAFSLAGLPSPRKVRRAATV
ncbi:helix-turn-helix domain-containing protein [Microbacterium sp. 2MCAF23]|uniref:helix-turn-helix domain-containing protein n=1 Tax=Microbacterium sp. 2MCAF23 TaxID=3232985 RepID=UPI003F9B2BCF